VKQIGNGDLLFFDPEDGGDMLLRNVSYLSTAQKRAFFLTTAVRTSSPT
jgi:hypothetical protein